VNHQHQLVTFTCFGTRLLFCALPLSHLSALIGHSRKHPLNVPTRPDRTNTNLTPYRSPHTTQPLPSHRILIQNP
jgi:hypothetical protein